MKKKTIKKPTPPTRLSESFETFTDIDEYDLQRIKQLEPWIWNGKVSFRKYKITIEPIEESNEVLAARLQYLWDISDNWHHSDSLKCEAAKIGYKLQGDRGSKLKG